MARTDLDYDSFRQYRASLTAAWEGAAEQFPGKEAEYSAAIELMGSRRDKPAPQAKKKLRTSQYKQKGITEDELERICHGAWATGLPNGRALVAYLQAGVLAGARFCEWPTANFGPSQMPGFKFQLTFGNGKHSNGRAHGETRTLLWEDLPKDLERALRSWIKISTKAAREGKHKRLQGTLGDLMHRVTEDLFRRDRQRRPTLSSVRDAAVARWKQAYIAGAKTNEEKQCGRAIVAALMGHASDESATKHYARARKGSKYPTPFADPVEVNRVLQRYKAPTFKITEHKPPSP